MKDAKEPTIKAMPVHQPWAWLIANGFCDVENRGQPIAYRGPLLIYSPNRMPRKDYIMARAFAREVLGDPEFMLPDYEWIELGAFVGIVDLVDILPPAEKMARWHMAGLYGFKFESPLAFPAISYLASGPRLFEVSRSELIKRGVDFDSIIKS